jgi:hypothetical protein
MPHLNPPRSMNMSSKPLIPIAVASALALAACTASAKGDDFLHQLQMTDGYTGYQQAVPAAREKAGAKGREGIASDASNARLHRWFEQQRMLTDGNTTPAPDTPFSEGMGAKGRAGPGMSKSQECLHGWFDRQRAYLPGFAPGCDEVQASEAPHTHPATTTKPWK